MTTAAVRGELVVDTLHCFRPMGLGPELECRYRVYALRDGIVVVLQEVPGSGIPIPFLYIEQLASEVLPNVVESADQRDRVSWIIQHPRTLFPRTDLALPEVFAQATFFDFFPARECGLLSACKYGFFSRPQWRCIGLDHLESMIGMPWDPAIPAITSADQWREAR